MKKILKDFLNNRISLDKVKNMLGANLHKVKIEEPINVCAKDVSFMLKRYIDGGVGLQELLDWVNVIWFTDLFSYSEVEEDSIASVMDQLETMDEDAVNFSNEELLKMLECLSENKEYQGF